MSGAMRSRSLSGSGHRHPADATASPQSHGIELRRLPPSGASGAVAWAWPVPAAEPATRGSSRMRWIWSRGIQGRERALAKGLAPDNLLDRERALRHVRRCLSRTTLPASWPSCKALGGAVRRGPGPGICLAPVQWRRPELSGVELGVRVWSGRPPILHALQYAGIPGLLRGGAARSIAVRYRAQNLLLLGRELLFYGHWDWRFLSLLLLSTVIDY